ncbi:MAG: DUF1501 domain-containing protein [Planctomycetota bacterium]
MAEFDFTCGSAAHLNRRAWLRLAGLSGASWLTPLATQLARASESRRTRPKSLIMLWLEGAPSQLETFDPHPGTNIAAGSTARKTTVPEIQLGSGLEQTAELMRHISLVRALTSKEGDHERAIYHLKTGYRLDATLRHPAIGSVICHHYRPEGVGDFDLPRHISILPTEFASRGGFLGDGLDAFKIGDPNNPIPDLASSVPLHRQQQRLADLDFLDQRFNRRESIENMEPSGVAGTRPSLEQALKMMSSEQLDAFDVTTLSRSERLRYGDTPFGRSCLAARRLIEAGVRCVEVTLSGWDTHVNNHELQAERIKILDPAFAALISDLNERGLLESTLVVCGGEFGRTPELNKLGGRDHWPHGFSVALAGGGIQGGRVVGKTSPAPDLKTKDPQSNLRDPHSVEDLHATILEAFSLDLTHEFLTPIGRPIKITEGRPIKSLFLP